MLTSITLELILCYSIMLICLTLCIAYAYLHFKRSASRCNSARWAKYLGNGGLFLMLAGPIVMCLFTVRLADNYMFNVDHFILSIISPFPFYITLLVITLFLAAKIKNGIFLHKVFLICIFIPLFMIPRILFLYLINPELYSDFLTMWNLVTDAVNAGTFKLPADDLYLSRILPIWTPMAMVFGTSEWVYKISNVVFLLLAGLMMYFLANKYFGRRSAQFAMLIFLAAPEPIYSIGIPTHDILGTFLLMAFLCILDWTYTLYIQRKPAAALGAIIAASVILVILDLQRNNGSMVIISLALCSILISVCAAWRHRARRGRPLLIAIFPLLVFLIVPLFAYRISWHILEDNNIANRFKTPMSFVYHHASLQHQAGTYGVYARMHAEAKDAMASMEPPLSDEFWENHAGHGLRSEFLFNQLRYLPIIVDRNRTVLSFGQSDFFYLSRLKADSIVKQDSKYIRWLRSYNDLFTMLMLLISGVSLVYCLAYDRWSLRVYFPLCILSVMAFLIITVGQTQPRYLYPLWFILPIYIGRAFCLAGRGKSCGLGDARNLLWGICVGASVLLLVFLAAMGVYAFSENKYMLMRDWDISSQSASGAADAGDYPQMNNVEMFLCLNSKPQAGDWVKAENSKKRLDPDKQYTMICFSKAPYPRSANAVNGFVVNMYINNELAKSLNEFDLTKTQGIRLDGIVPDIDGKVSVCFEIVATESFADPNRQRSRIKFSRMSFYQSEDLL